jgi:hypothetical protein
MNAKAWGIEFVNALNNKSWDDVIKIKNESIPDRIYKYIPLFDKKWSGYLKENKDRLTSLENQMVWASSPEKLNDPFELKALALDVKLIEKAGWDIELCQHVMDLFASKIKICCFSNGYRKRIPLWSHYANNHQGYCVEYATIDKNPIFPVRYSNQRLISATIVTRFCNAFLDGYKQKKEPSSEFWKYYRILLLTYCTKSAEWQYEHEFRFFDTNDDDDKPGKLIPLSLTGLKINKIYIGLNCASEYENELRSIGKTFNYPVYKMEIVESSKYFSLQPR